MHDPGHRRFPLPVRIITAIGGVTDYRRLSFAEEDPVADAHAASGGPAAAAPPAAASGMRRDPPFRPPNMARPDHDVPTGA